MDERLTISTHEADRGSAQAADRFRAVAADTGLVDVAVGTVGSPVGRAARCRDPARARGDLLRGGRSRPRARSAGARAVAPGAHGGARHGRRAPGARRVLPWRAPPVRPASRPAPDEPVREGRPRGDGPGPLRPPGHLRRDRRKDRPPEGGASGRRGARREPDPDRRPLPPGDRGRREPHRLRRAACLGRSSFSVSRGPFPPSDRRHGGAMRAVVSCARWTVGSRTCRPP